MPCAVTPGQRARRPCSSRPASRSPLASPATMPRRGAVLIRSAHDAARRGGEEGQHGVDVAVRDAALRAAQRGDGGLGLIQRESAPVEQLVHLADDPDALGAEITALQADDIHRARGERVAVHRHERWHVVGDMGLEADHRVVADAHALQDAAQAADGDPVAHGHMAGKGHAIGQRVLVAEHGVVGDVAVSHDPVVIADAGLAPVLDRADVQRAELADGVAVADDQRGRLATVLLVLIGRADGAELEEGVVAADARVAFDHDMRADLGAGADLHMRADQRVGADLDGRVQLGCRVDEGRRVDAAHQASIRRMVHISSASAATCSPTSALAANL
mmetsp:Transcript_5757/g.14036  ORF Transcript_5757/g.14036 Transcript_5757/m.14036 type:complete len:333 (-) Transcript_5757:537-1535(-)